MLARVSAPRRSIGQGVRLIRSPESGTIGQGVRFALAGGVVALVYLTTTTVLADVFAVPFQRALLIGFLAAVCVHFTLQRFFVWVHNAEFALGVRKQVGRYLLVAVSQYVFTAISTSVFPGALSVPVTLVYLVTVATLTAVNFVVFRGIVFHAAE
jgi:putative flippase GtrA